MTRVKSLLAVLGVMIAITVTIRARSVPEPAQASWSDEDWAVFEEKSRWALDAGLDTLPLGDAMARMGGAFVGTAYVPGTLEVEGPERLVINFRGLDCVTFVENVFALTRFVRSPEAEALLDQRGTAEDRYESLLADLRYRGGQVSGYSSRLHYFVDWVTDNQARGNVEDLSESLGGVRDTERIDFMSRHPEAYRQLSDPDNLRKVTLTEELLSREGRHFLPADDIARVAERIRDGDIIAATSAVEGLDVAHTGLALWVDGELRLLHAPLVGEAVQISDTPLADRIRGIGGQDGIIVARPRG